jgi:subtilisin family serine protease
MHRRIVVALACLLLGSPGIGPIAPPAAAHPASALVDPNVMYDARRIVVELAPATPRPARGGGGADAGADASAGRALATGIAALDALNASLGVVAWEPGFPEAAWPSWRKARLDAAPPAEAAREDLSRFVVITLPEGASLAGALAEYGALPGVLGAEPVPQLPVELVPNDSLLLQQYALLDLEDHDIDAPEAWDVFRGDTSMVVAIIDTGVESTHPDLGGPAPSTGGVLWTNYAELGGAPGLDDDGNGYVDDVHGWDFVSGQVGAPGEDTTVPDNDPSDFAGHGTLVAGCAVAVTNNGAGIAGTGFRSRYMPLRVGWSTNQSPNGIVDMVFCANAITYAAHNGAIAVNCSWSNQNASMLVAAVNDAIARGVTIVVAAGNQGTVSPPNNYLASRGDCVDVAATDANDVHAGFTNYGIWVDVSAAGVDVLSTTGRFHTIGYGTGNGTSFAAPRVAGAVALYQGYRKSLGLPTLPPAEMILRLRDTGDDIDSLNGVFAGTLGTRLNLHRLLADPPTSWVRSVSGSANSPATADLDENGQDEIVLGGVDGRVVALRAAAGDTLAGWPVNLGAAIHSSAAIWDLDDDHAPEVLIGTDGGRVYALNGDGSNVAGWPVQLSGAIYAGPAIADVDPAPGLECVVASSTGQVWLLGADGAVKAGFPVALDGPIFGTPVLHDFDGDGFAEIVAAGYDSSVAMWNHDGQLRPGWPRQLGHVTSSAPAVGDIDGDGLGDVVLGANDAKVYAFHADGSPLTGWPVSVQGAVRSSPALADLIGADGVLEVAIPTDQPAIEVLRGDGTAAPGWPRFLVGFPSSSVAIGDVDDDGGLDVICGARDSYVQAIHANGLTLQGWPKKFDGPISGAPTLADPDRDGRLELLFVSENGRLRNVDFGPGTYDPVRLPWPTMHRDFLRRGSTSPALVDVSPGGPGAGGAGAGAIALAVRAAPNPSRGAMTIELVRGERLGDGPASVPPTVSLYDVAGRRVRTIAATSAESESVRLVWDGRDDSGRVAAPGLYFARVSWAGAEASTRLVVLP